MGGRGASGVAGRTNRPTTKRFERNEYKFPELQGTKKQVEWAEEIRSKFIGRVERVVSPYREAANKEVDAINEMLKSGRSSKSVLEENAKSLIRRSEDGGARLGLKVAERMERLVYGQIQNVSSAAKIINARDKLQSYETMKRAVEMQIDADRRKKRVK